VVGEVEMLLDVTLEIHRDEGGELHEARIDLSERARRTARHVVDQVALEPLDRLALGEVVDLVGCTRVSIGPAIRVSVGRARRDGCPRT
jgi:hypothetical protein